MAEIVYAPLDKEAEHEHDEAHFYLALKGKCVETYGKESRDFRPSTVGFLPSGHAHAVEYCDREFQWFRVNASPAWISKVDRYMDSQLRPFHTSNGILPELFWRLYREYSFPDAVSPLVAEALVVEMVGEVSRQGRSSNERSAPRWLVQARDFVEANFAEQVRLVSIAETVSVHPVHLAREFRRHFNCSIGEYVRNRRVEYVQRQLTVSDMSLVEIALAAGFCDQSHLSRTFKRTVGLTPTEYRTASRRSSSAWLEENAPA